MSGLPRLIPDYPRLLATVTLRGDMIAALDRRAGQRIEVHGGPGELRELYSILQECDGTNPLRLLLDRTDSAHLASVCAALAELSEAGVLVDSRAYPRWLVEELARSPPVSVDELSIIGSRSRWQDPRVIAGASAVHPRATTSVLSGLERPSSSPLETDSARNDHPVDLIDLATLLASAYRAQNTWKPVASAGRLWPVVIHVIVTGGSRLNLYWFDDVSGALLDVSESLTIESVAACFIQREFIAHVIEAGGALTVLSADFARIGAKYGNRSVLYVAFEMGALNQQMALTAPRLKLRLRAIGGFSLTRLRKALDIEVDPLLAIMVTP